MAIGMRPKRKGLFGAMQGPMSNGPYGTPPLNPEAQQPQGMQPVLGMMQQPEPQQAEQPYNPAGNKLYALGGIIANLGGVRNNAAGEYFATQQQQAQQATQAAAAQQQAQAKRMAEREDFVFEHDYKRDNPAAAAPDAFERAMSMAGIQPGTPEYQEAVQGRLASMTRDPNDEYVVVPMPNGTYVGPRSGMAQAMGGGGQTQPRPVAPSDWDSAKPVSGGGGGNVTSGFLDGL